MLKENKKLIVITGIVTLIPIVVGIILWDQLPDPMVTHFGISSEANGYSSKLLAVVGLPVIILLIHLALAFFTAHDPKKQNISPKVYKLTLCLVPVISLAASGAIYAYNLGLKVKAGFIAEIIGSLLLIAIGNYMPKARQNHTIGIRLPWTLASEENWDRTHRLAGFVWVAGGIVMLVLALCRILCPWLTIVLFLVIVLVPIVYSFLLYTKSSER